MERFSQRAWHVLSLAQEEAERLQHSTIGTEHLLVGILREAGGIGAHVLHDLGIMQRQVEELAEKLSPAGQRDPNTQLELSAHVKRVLELAVAEARKLGDQSIGTEHLLLGLIDLNEGTAVDLLKQLNVSPEQVRSQTRRTLEQTTADPNPPAMQGYYSSRPTRTGVHNRMERFTQRARRVLSLAQEEAERLQHEYIGTEHMLLGLMREEGGVAGRVLRDLGLEQNRVQELVERMTPSGQRVPNTRLDLSGGTKKLLELAVDEARRMGHHYIGTEHLLLGLVRQNDGIGVDVLKRLNVVPEEVRRQTRRVLQESPLQPNRPPSQATQVANVNPYNSAANVPSAQAKHGTIFISSRLEDSPDVTGQIYDQLAAHFGAEKIVRGTNVDALPLGKDIRAYVQDLITWSAVVLVIIGPEWIKIADASGRRKLDDAADLVRMEVEAALQSDMPVIPVLVQGASMPKLEQLPRNLANLAYRNGISIRGDADFKVDVEKLIQDIEQALTR